MPQKRMRLLPEGFTRGMKEVAGDFAWGIWDAMSPGSEPRSKGWRRGTPRRKPRRSERRWE